MKKGHGDIQRAIITWLQKFPDGGDVIGIAAGVYRVRTRTEVTKAQRVAARRAITRLVGQGLIELSPYRSLHGYENWQTKREALHPSRRAG